MKIIHAHLQLSTNMSGRTRERCPEVVFTESDNNVAAIRTDTEHPTLPFSSGSVDSLVIHDDALSRSIDEEAWISEFARVLASGGMLRFTLPAAGILAWMDSMNMYRYLADISGRGHAPDAALPTGWNRHYTREHIQGMLADAGLPVHEIKAQNHAAKETGMMLGLLGKNWIRQQRDAERQLFPRFGSRDPRDQSILPATTWSVTARKR